MKSAKSLLLLLILLVVPSKMWAQFEVSTTGGGVVNETGSFDYTLGQVSSAYDVGYQVGVHQPYAHPSFDTLRGVVCQGNDFVGFGYTIPADSLATAGVHSFLRRYENAGGFDSIVTLIVEVLPTSSYTDEFVVCDSLVWHGSCYYNSVSGPTFTTTAANGCDSVVTLSLTVHHSSRSSFSEQVSESYTWNGQVYTASGRYTQTFTNAAGCDSVVTLTLSLIDQPVPHIVAYRDKIVMVDHYPNGENQQRVDYIGYRWYDDNGAVGSNLDHYCDEHDGVYRPLSGYYYVEVPTDRTQAYWVRSNTVCIVPTTKRISEDAILSLYPNPARAGHNVVLTVDDNAIGARLELYDINGRLLLDQTVSDNETFIKMPLSSGGYTIRLTPKDGNPAIRKIIVR